MLTSVATGQAFEDIPVKVPLTKFLTAGFATLFLSNSIPAAAAPLFDDEQVLNVRLEGPLSTLIEERSDQDELAGKFAFADADGSEIVVDIKFRARGNYRRQRKTCPFPPIRLNFPKSAVKQTTFDGQDKLKLVTHCNSRRGQYEQQVLREYLAYRFLNVLTDKSFKVRLLRVTYVDTELEDEAISKLGFLIEDEDSLVERLGVEAVKTDSLTYADIHPEFTNTINLFQYMIGNTDYSLIRGPVGDNCCHNAVPVTDGGPILSIPYDFDLSGLVNAPYATPDPRLKLSSVRQRLYRGRCFNNSTLPATIARYQGVRSDLFAAIDAVEQLNVRNRQQVNSYLEAFFETIADERKLEREFFKKCS